MRRIAEKKGEVTYPDALRKHLGKKGYDPLMGARPMQGLIQDMIRRALAAGGRLAAWPATGRAPASCIIRGHPPTHRETSCVAMPAWDKGW